jgi:VWFA-related protein
MKKFITSCLTILVLASFSHAQPQTPLSAREIIDRMVKAYAACRSYSDEGEVSTVRAGTEGSAPRVQNFQTAFVRPSSFRFGFWPSGRREGRMVKEGRMDGPEYIFWKEGDEERSWTPPVQNDLGLETSLFRFAFPSQGASVIIPHLLLPGLFRGTSVLSSIEDPKLTKEEKVDGRKTFKIEGKFQGLPLHVWIDSRDFLIIKIHRMTMMGQIGFESITKYKPRVNEEVSRDKLAYNPPPESRKVQGLNSGPAGSTPISSTALRRSVIEEAPRLRNFGSSLRANNDQTERIEKRANADEDDVVRVVTNLVVSDILVLDKQGKFIEGLSKEDFVVKEDDQPQEVGTFSMGDAKAIRRSIVLIVDYSGSQSPYVKYSMEAAKMLVDKLNPNDRMAIVTDDVKLLIDFTSDKELLKAKLESVKVTALSGKLGRSLQYDALMATLKEIFSNEDLRPIIIFQTDGDQLDALGPGTRPSPYLVFKTFTIEDLTTASEKVGATIYSVIPGIRFFGFSEEEQLKRAMKDWENRREADVALRRLSNLPPPPDTTPSDTILARQAAVWTRRQLALFGLARFTGGWTDFLEQPEQADEVYTRILRDINRRYIIGYYPTNRTRDGKRRKVSIEVRGHPEYIVWGRRAYFAPGPE